MKKEILLSLAALSLCSLSLRAEEAKPAAPAEPTAPSATTTFTSTFVSQYMFRGVRLGGPAFQPAIEVAYGSLGVGLWTSFPLKDKVVGVSDPELDPYAYYTITVNDAVSIVPGVTWYNYPNAKTADGFFKSTFEPSLALNYTVSGLKFTPKIYYDTILKGPAYELTAFYAIPLADISSELDLSAVVGTFDQDDVIKGASPSVKNTGDYWQVGASMPFALTKESKLTIGVAYTKGSNNYLKQGTDPKFENTMAVGRGVVTIAYAYSF